MWKGAQKGKSDWHGSVSEEVHGNNTSCNEISVPFFCLFVLCLFVFV